MVLPRWNRPAAPLRLTATHHNRPPTYPPANLPLVACSRRRRRRRRHPSVTHPPTHLATRYGDGDLCRSLDQGKLYQAKVVKAGEDDQYFIHYQGWNKKWDKWVHASLMMAEGPEAEKYAKKLADAEKKREEATLEAAAAEAAAERAANG